MVPSVFCEHCNDVHLVDDVVRISVEETPNFRIVKQVLTFTCPVTNKQAISSVRGHIG
jgi:hypothetical protein